MKIESLLVLTALTKDRNQVSPTRTVGHTTGVDDDDYLADESFKASQGRCLHAGATLAAFKCINCIQASS